MTSGDNFVDRYKQAAKVEQERKQKQRDGDFGEDQAEHRRMIDETTLPTKIASFILWGVVLLVLFWLIFL